MPGSNSVVRRYTPPTCTLEILAESSPLSRWMGQTVVGELRFQLHFDDPTLPEDLRIPIEGNREQLEVLCNAVSSYVQQLLQDSSDRFGVIFRESTPSESEDLGSSGSPASPLHYRDNTGVLEATIYLEFQENLTHKLYLGSLATQRSGPVIELSLLQLFDLSSALDEYSADIIALPTGAERFITSKLPTWAPVAAVLTLALGLTPLTWQYANNMRSVRVVEQQKPQEPIPTGVPNIGEPTVNPDNPDAGVKSPDLADLPSPNFNLPSPNQENSDVPRSGTVPPTATPGTLSKNTPNTPTLKTPQIAGDPILNSPNSTQVPSKILGYPTNPGIQGTQGIKPSLNIPAGDVKRLPDSLPNPNPSPPQTQPTLPLDTGTAKQDLTIIASEENKSYDTPQVAEAGEYLQGKWRPPADFTQTLEYSITLEVNGTIQRILPLNKAAREYIDNTGIPEIGKPFVSSNKAGKTLRIRVVYSPDGKVKTFTETP
ncbi:hypothetical protein B7O87_02450 [Cylindrospermopsis raciborskii CENA303]|uniref:DUF4335 domain-containing protein n=1 Tax=Cylindrospermopsis raciborskii CENA303 TaxID=1170769 RepID=A0A1X4GBV2_9CYAN|nr:DUF4335 domain-containing protein [Cylindrospermopsis raciborskii]OSO94658.1 hypothetical protein B7O87_02450 [Cylindrospermopsis raciborskii CENA303]